MFLALTGIPCAFSHLAKAEAEATSVWFRYEACRGMTLCSHSGTHVGEHGHREETSGIGVLLLLVTALHFLVMPLFPCQMQTLRLKRLIQVRVNFARYRTPPQRVAVNISCGGCLACVCFL